MSSDMLRGVPYRVGLRTRRSVAPPDAWRGLRWLRAANSVSVLGGIGTLCLTVVYGMEALPFAFVFGLTYALTTTQRETWPCPHCRRPFEDPSRAWSARDRSFRGAVYCVHCSVRFGVPVPARQPRLKSTRRRRSSSPGREPM